MKIHTSLNDVKDQLISFISEGYGILGEAFMNSFNSEISNIQRRWENKVVEYLVGIFPTKKETGQFLHSPGPALHFNNDNNINDAMNRLNISLKALEQILDTLERYYQFEPESFSLNIQDIDSFSKVRGVNHRDVEGYLKNGFLNRDEDAIKIAFAEIIEESFVPEDWPGETEDLYTSRMWYNGQRVRASIIFNGPGKVKAKQTRLRDLGARGDQLVRMMRVDSSKLYILQSVKPISHEIVVTFEALIKDQRSKGNLCYACVIDGQDTAEILSAYGYLP